MFCRLNLGPQDSLLSQVFLHSSTRCYFTERRGGGVMFLLRLVCAHLINVNNCCYGRCYGKSRILLIRFLKSRCFNAGNRVRLFQDSIPKCLKFTILPLKKSDFCNLTSPFLSIRPPFFRSKTFRNKTKLQLANYKYLAVKSLKEKDRLKVLH